MMNSTFYLPKFKAEWKKIIDSKGNYTLEYQVEETQGKISFVINDKSFQVRHKDKDCKNPIGALLELASAENDDKSINTVIEYISRFGIIVDGQGAVNHTDLQREARRVRQFTELLHCFYKMNSPDFFDYRDLFVCAANLYMDNALYFFDEIHIPERYIASYEEGISEEKSRQPANLGYLFIRDLLEVNNKQTLKNKLEATKRAIDNAISYQNKPIESDYDDFNDNDHLPNDTAKNIPPFLSLLNIIYNLSKYYIDETHHIIFEDDNTLDNLTLTRENIINQIRDFAANVIEEEMNTNLKSLQMVYSVESGKSIIEVSNLKDAIYYSLSILDVKKYGYYPCSNPNCNRYVLRSHPNNKYTKDSSYTRKDNKFCCDACGRRFAQTKWKRNNPGKVVEQREKQRKEIKSRIIKEQIK